MICSKCGKRPAVVFVSVNKDDTSPQKDFLFDKLFSGVQPTLVA